MKLTIKHLPEDFRVEEIVNWSYTPQGAYAVYRLQKRNWHTLDALQLIAKRFSLPISALAYGGKKDQHGLTTQYLTVHDRKPLTLQEETLRLDFCGYADQPMEPEKIETNQFNLVVRNLTPLQTQHACASLPALAEFGFINYFDDQRFRGFDPTQGFLGERLLKRHWNGALKTYLLSVRQSDTAAIRDHKQRLNGYWKNWPLCLQAAETDLEKLIFQTLHKQSNAWLTLVDQIPREEQSMALTIYQAYLWNELVRRALRGRSSPPWLGYPGIAGDYLFPAHWSSQEFPQWEKLSLPTLDRNLIPADPFFAGLHRELLNEQGLQHSLLARIKLKQAFLKGHERKLLIVPAKLSAQSENDTCYPDMQMLLLSFSLPRGSYATMLLKCLFSEPILNSNS